MFRKKNKTNQEETSANVYRGPGIRSLPSEIRLGLKVVLAAGFVLTFAFVSYNLLKKSHASPIPNIYSCPKVNGQYPSLKKGSRDGDNGKDDQCVSAIQWGFKNQGGQRQITVNGLFDDATKVGVQNFQKLFYSGLFQRGAPDGVMTPDMMRTYEYFFGAFKTTNVTPPPPPPPVGSSVKATTLNRTSDFMFGATHTQHSLDSWGDALSVAQGKALLNASTNVQVQSIMGWGVLNPEPSPGTYDFSTLDARINTVMSGAPTKVITLCGAPDWMKGGVSGSTDWSKLEVAPTPDHYDDFANLAATIAKRYPSVKYFQVWNELKGFYLPGPNRWDYEGYTTLYNKVYAKIKAVRPDAKVGGPYVVMDSWSGPQSNPSSISGSWGRLDQRSLDVVSYWLQHKVDADFIALDGASSNRDGNLVDDFTATDKFTAITSWLRSLPSSTYPGATTLPLWWAEWYPSSGSTSGAADLKRAVMATNIIKNMYSGAQEISMWQPQGDASGNSYPLGIFTDTTNPGGGKPTAFYSLGQVLHDNFSAGTKLYNTNNTNAAITILASDKKMLLVNTSASTQSITTYSTTHTMAPYSIELTNVEVAP